MREILHNKTKIHFKMNIIKFFLLIYLLDSSYGESKISSSNYNCTGSESPLVCVIGMYERDVDISIEPFKTWVEAELSVTKEIDTMSMCFHLFFLGNFNAEKGSSTVIFSVDFAFVLFVQNKHLVMATDNVQIVSIRSMKIRSWMSICLVMGKETNIYVDNIKGSNSGATPLKISVGAKVLTFGSSRNFFSDNKRPNRIILTIPQIMFSAITEQQVKQFSTCSSEGWPSPIEPLNIQKWLTVKKETDKILNVTMDITKNQKSYMTNRDCLNFEKNSVSVSCSSAVLSRNLDVVIKSVSIVDVCEPLHDTMIIVEEGSPTYTESENLCRRLQGKLISVLDEHFEQKMEKFVTSNELSNSLVYARRDNNNTECYIVEVTGEYFRLVPVNCSVNDPTLNAFCEVSLLTKFSFRVHLEGQKRLFDPFNNELFAEDFQLIRDKYGRYYFASVTGLEIKKSSRNEFSFTSAQGMLMTLNSKNLFGSRNWLIKLLNSSYEIMKMIFSGCKQNEFTCYSGTCIPLDQRCNGNIDCDDRSDEICQILVNDEYDDSSSIVQMPPYIFTPIQLTIQLIRVQNVYVDENIIRARLKIFTTWKDPRLQFSQLQKWFGDNVITSRIWKPRFKYTNVKFEDLLSYFNGDLGTSQTFAILEKDVSPFLSINGVEHYVYNGESDSSIQRIEEFAASFICDFELSLFPFDVNRCFLNISIINKGSSKAYFNISETNFMSDSFVATLFVISKLYFNTASYDNITNTTSLSFSVIVDRRFASFILTTILPCVIIGSLGTLTHLFKLDNFTDRIMVTLSCLIVLASLFSQLSTNVPSSAIPKAIECFFFFFIIKLCYVFICHTLLALLGFYREDKENERIYMDNLFDYRPEAVLHPASKHWKPSRRGRSIIIPMSPEKQFSKKYKSPTQKKYCISVNTLNTMCIYSSVILDFIFVTLFFGVVFYYRNTVYAAQNNN